MAGAHPYFTYTTEILSWRLGHQVPGVALPACDPDRAAVRAGRIVRAARDRRQVLLLGLGTGDLAAALAASLPSDSGLTVLCPAPETALAVRDAGRLSWLTPAGPHQLLADSSRQALFCLPALVGDLGPTTLVTVNPEPAPPATREALAQVRRLCSESVLLPSSSSPTAPAVPLTLAVLARPEEPGLAAFFQACAGLAGQAVILWDATDVPGRAREAEALDMPVRHLARPLGRDFAGQRNTLLAACPPGWILSLDPDERPGPGFREMLERLTRATPGLAGAFFPRLTLYPDAGHAKAGHGLWPDLQLRLFSNQPPSRPRYVRPVHERLEGLAGKVALALDAPLFHLNRLLADETAVTAKLAAYDAAAGQPRHHLSQAYPTLPLEFFTSLSTPGAQGRVLHLPVLW